MSKKNKKILLWVGSIIVGVIIAVNLYYMFVPREVLTIGTREGENISLSETSRSRQKLKIFHEIMEHAKKIELTEQPTGTEEHYLSISIRKHNDIKQKYFGGVFYQKDGTSILIDMDKEEYFKVDKKDTDKLKKIFKE